MKSRGGQSKLRQRSLLVVIFMVGWILLIIGRLICLQIVQHEALAARAERQRQRVVRISPLRGMIYDRLGRELARSVEVQSVFAVPAELASVAQAATELARVLGLNRSELLQKLSSEREFVWIKRKLSDEEVAAVKSLGLSGIHFVSENKRYYPNRQLAAHVLGYVGIDEVGLDGVELAYDEHLRGQEGYVLVQRDARGRSYGLAQPPVHKGQDVTLTIDAVIQQETEQALEQAVRHSSAQSGVAIVMQPRTGEILAMASMPRFDPNEFTGSSEQQRRNRAVRDLYEPGSVFKIVTYAAALQERLVGSEDMLDCSGGRVVLAGHVIRDHKTFSVLSVQEALENSSNVGAIRLGLRLGQQRLGRYIHQFGFGQRTGVELSGEAAGLVRPVQQWSAPSIGAISIGQEIGVTPLQMLAAVAVVANDGVWVQPRLVRAVHSRAGDVITEPEAHTRRVISPQVARTVARMLEGVVLRGTGKRARLNGYSAAGKTGTAQQFDPATGRYSTHRYVASFAGFAPVNHPQVAVIVVIDGPRGAYHGGQVAAPVFQRIAEMALQYLNVMPDSAKPNVEFAAWGQAFASEETGGAIAETTPTSQSDEPLQQPVQAHSRQATMEVGLTRWSNGLATAQPAQGHEAAPVMPSFHGHTLRSVADTCARLGLRLVVVGSGRAVNQTPAPGTPIAIGQTCQVEFAQ